MFLLHFSFRPFLKCALPKRFHQNFRLLIAVAFIIGLTIPKIMLIPRNCIMGELSVNSNYQWSGHYVIENSFHIPHCLALIGTGSCVETHKTNRKLLAKKEML